MPTPLLPAVAATHMIKTISFAASTPYSKLITATQANAAETAFWTITNNAALLTKTKLLPRATGPSATPKFAVLAPFSLTATIL
jgi:hypothetical protein